MGVFPSAEDLDILKKKKRITAQVAKIVGYYIHTEQINTFIVTNMPVLWGDETPAFTALIYNLLLQALLP